MSNNNKTVFQKLSDIFTRDGVAINKQNTNRYSIGNNEILRTSSKEEFETAKLQAQQKKYLSKNWAKIDSEMFQKSVHYETTRVGSYSDFENMEFYPEIAAALDIMMEESTTVNNYGKVLNIYSNSKRVKTILEDLMFSKLDLHTNLPMWTRNTPIREDSIIPLLDGTEVTIKVLSEMVKNGEEVWSYSIQDETKAIVPSKITWCDLTRKDSELYRVTLDDGTYIDTTPDHEYMLRDGSFKRADELIEGQPLMPFHTKKSENKIDSIGGYEKVYNPSSIKYRFTHSMVSNQCIRDLVYEKSIGGQFVTHHIDFNKLNNTPSNLIRLTCSYNLKLPVEHFDKTLDSPEVTKKKVGGVNVFSVEKLTETSDVYCLEAVGPNGEQDRHNFPVCSKDSNSQYVRGGVFLSNCKYGDNFLHLNIDDKKGVIGVRQLPNFEIERRDFDFFENMGVANSDDSNNKTKFLWKGRDVVFNSWQIAHFRLLGDDRKLPYGTSVLEKARLIWKQLRLSEDAMLIYRVTRAPERRVYKIFVGNIDNEDVESYVNDIANKFKRTPLIDAQTGQMDLRYNQMGYDQDIFIPTRTENAETPIDTLPGACIALDTRIPLLDGRTLELSEIISEWDNGNKDMLVYSCDPNTGAMAPGIITWAGETRMNTEVMKITLDNGESITTTPDHKWVHRTKGFVEAQDLVVGDSLMPFYRDTNEREKVWDSAKQEWVFTYIMVNDFTKNEGVENKMSDAEANYNHKIITIEFLELKQDTGTITVDGDELYHNYHTFATEAGVFIKNSNLDQIADIEYLQRKLFTALRVPKSFLGFDEATGEGKNLALQDIRFSRTINRIQQSMIQELNKIAIIHLYLLGFEDDLDNFTLTLNNPSTQAEMLKVEHLGNKFDVYKNAVSDAGNGFATMSMTRAKRDILGWSADEIKQDLIEQRMEKAAASELENTSNVIKHTGYFDTVDKIYGDMDVALKGGGGEDDADVDSEGGSPDGGGFGGGFSDDAGGDDLDFGDEDDTIEDDAIEGGTDDAIEGGADDAAEDGEGDDFSFESKTLRSNLINEKIGERKLILNKKLENRKGKYVKNYLNKLIESVTINGVDDTVERNIDSKNEKINSNINKMMIEIDKKLKE